MRNENDMDFDDELLDLWLLREARERELNGENRKSGNGLFWFSVLMILLIIVLQ